MTLEERLKGVAVEPTEPETKDLKLLADKDQKEAILTAYRLGYCSAQYDLADKISDMNNALKTGTQALDEVLDNYDMRQDVDISEALRYIRSLGTEQETHDIRSERSWEYIRDYKRIMWLLHVASDYCSHVIGMADKIVEEV